MVILHNIPFSTFNLDISAPADSRRSPSLFRRLFLAGDRAVKDRKAHTTRFEPIYIIREPELAYDC